jgi:superfamily II DNA or RNA helicase
MSLYLSDISSPKQDLQALFPPHIQDDGTPLLPGITLQNGFRLRAGQWAFLQKFADALQRGDMSHLGVFVPGYGKTITALASFAIARHLGFATKLVVFVPRGNLRDQ